MNEEVDSFLPQREYQFWECGSRTSLYIQILWVYGLKFLAWVFVCGSIGDPTSLAHSNIYPGERFMHLQSLWRIFMKLQHGSFSWMFVNFHEISWNLKSSWFFSAGYDPLIALLQFVTNCLNRDYLSDSQCWRWLSIMKLKINWFHFWSLCFWSRQVGKNNFSAVWGKDSFCIIDAPPASTFLQSN